MGSTGVYVPMLVNAYLNYDRRQDDNVADQAYLAPLTTPNFNSLQLDSEFIQHDIFDDLPSGPYLSSADIYRVSQGRTGIYVHWILPKLYRNGITGSATADVQARAAQAGFSSASAEPGQPIFPQVPTRWVIMRRIMRPDGNMYAGWPVQRYSDGSLLTREDNMDGAGSGGDIDIGGVLTQFFMIEGDSVRSITDIPPEEDLEVTSAPLIDFDLPPSRQGQTFLGQRWKLADWPGESDTRTHIPLTVHRAANPYFSDYQPQNSSVFSFFDDMSFVDSAGTGKFCNVNVSYTIVGFHADAGTDPLHAPLVDGQTKFDRLTTLGLEPMNDLTRTDLDRHDRMRTFCHGSMYNIAWERALPDKDDSNTVPPTRQRDIIFPADEVQTEFLKSHPVAVGTNPLDALFGWLRTIPDDVDTGLPPQDVVSAELIKKNILKLQTLLLDLDDNLDAQLQAEDMLAMNNHISCASGTLWHLQSQEDDTKNVTPDKTTVELLRSLNENQTRINAFIRQQKRSQTELFNVWWTYACDRMKGGDRRQNASQAAGMLKQKLVVLSNTIIQLKILVESIKNRPALKDQLKEGAEMPFYLQRDPTILVAGLRSAWPANTDAQLPVRSISNTNVTIGNHSPGFTCIWNYHDNTRNKLPGDVVESTEQIFSESCKNWTDDLHTEDHDPYYKSGDRFTGSNGWFPLFIEWEAEYYNIPFEKWIFSEAAASGVVGYHIKDDVNVASGTIRGDVRTVTGRCPIIPQASSVLATTLQQAFNRIGPSNLPLTLDQQDEVTRNARELDTVSSPLAGFTNQLITQMQGTHMTPVIYDSDGTPQFIDSGAAAVSGELSLNAKDLAFSGSEIDTTPFASLVGIPADRSAYSPFKPCTHGQFRFTKFNIIDKFGQVVQGIKTTCDLAHDVGATRMPLFPCLGEAYSVDSVTVGQVDKARTVIPRDDQLCEFVQLPPSINQNARINADFLVDHHTGSMVQANELRAASDWDNPVRGWLVLNYANASMQVFGNDGVFIGEFQALTGTPVSKPFPTDQFGINSPDPFLTSFLRQIESPGSLQNLFSSLSKTVATIQANPSSYSEAMLSIFGRPLALVSFGVSLELADPPLKNQCTVAPTDPNVGSADVTSYQFPVKVGDKNNVFDGLYGYFQNQAAGKYAPSSPYILPDTGTFYTYHPSDAAGTAHKIIPPAALTLKPYYPDPMSGTLMSSQRLAASTILSALVDPFTPIHLYSALLPIKTLSIPHSALDAGLKQIATFFRTGPILLDEPLPAYDEGRKVNQDYRLDDESKAPTANGTIGVPGVSIGEWAWLQPYKDSQGQTAYNAMDVVKPESSSRPMWKKGPYVATEGFLQQKVPFQPPSAGGQTMSS
ncbi:MAG: hypothetical protein Q9224_003863 [Gallowayella concinna]